MFKVGDKVKCKTDKVDPKAEVYSMMITPGKWYEIVKLDDPNTHERYIHILNESYPLFTDYFYEWNFYSVAEIRKEKIKKIFNEHNLE